MIDELPKLRPPPIRAASASSGKENTKHANIAAQRVPFFQKSIKIPLIILFWSDFAAFLSLQ
jgi:hypothetical protein